MSSDDDDGKIKPDKKGDAQVVRYQTVRFRKRNGAASQVPKDYNEELESPEYESIEEYETHVDVVTPSPRAVEREKSISEEIREAYKVANWSPNSSKKWFANRLLAQQKDDREMLLTLVEHGMPIPAVAPKYDPNYKLDPNEPNEVFYYPTIMNGNQVITHSSGPRGFVSGRCDPMELLQPVTVGDFLATTRLESKMISNKLSKTKKAALDQATSNYVTAVDQLSIAEEKDTSPMVEEGFCCYTTDYKPSKKEMDFEKKFAAYNRQRNTWCIHEVMFYANKFVQNLFYHARSIVESLPRDQAEAFDKAFIVLSLAAKVLRDDDPLRDIARECPTDCRWREMLKNDIITKCMIFGHTINKSEAETLYE